MNNQYLAAFQDHTPALISASNRAWFETCMQNVSGQLPDIQEKMAARADDSDWWGMGENDTWLRRVRPYVVKDGVLQIPVKGVLLDNFPYQMGGWATGYEYIWRAFERGMGDYNVRGIALVVDSPGGMVKGCFEMVDKMWTLKGKAKKPVRGYASDAAYSAAYATISVADTITVSRTGGVGSIGVVTSHVDISGMMKDFGWVVTFIFAGQHKVDGNAYEALPDDVKARIQARIDDLYGIFVSTVARNRGMDEQAIRDTEALTYNAPDSLSVGLADAIGAFDDALADFTASLNPLEGDEPMAEGITQAQHDEAVTAARTEGHAAGRTEGVTAERSRISAILGSDAAKGRTKLANHIAFKTSMSVDDGIAMLAEAETEQPAAAAQPAAVGAGAGAAVFNAAMDNTQNPGVGASEGGSQEPNLASADGILALAAKAGLKGFVTTQ